MSLCGVAAERENGLPDDARYAGSQSCRECHPRFFELWSTSHHGTAMQPFTAELATSRLSAHPQPLASGPYRYQAEPLAWRVQEQGPDGEKNYVITHVLGGKNVFYFLTPLERGRLQVLPLAYDVNRREWFDTALSAMRHLSPDSGATDAPLFWREAPYTFNTSCFNCHVSQLTKNYDVATDAYRTRWGEPGINCETCHGPAAEHIRAARKLAPGAPMKEPQLIAARTLSVPQINTLCGSCHAKLTPLTATFTAGDRFFDQFRLTTLEDADFYPDGRDLGENFTLTTWQLSPCAQSERLSCTHCHTSSGRYRFAGAEPNAACLPCHAERVKNVAAHSHHEPDSRGSQCIACHMPKTEFARMRRSDHSMRPPTPAATIAFKSPNACTLCHSEQSAEWADREVRQWHARDYQRGVLQRSTWIASARKGEWSMLPEIIGYLTGAAREEVWTVSLLRLLRGCPDERKWTAVNTCLTDKSPLVRAAAVEAFSEQPPAEAIPALLAATRDDFRLVRVQAAAALVGLPRDVLTEGDRRTLARATDEYIASMRVRPDDSASHYNLGNFHLGRGEPKEAVGEFDHAIRLQPRSVPPWANRGLAFAALGENARAEASLRQALALEPNNGAIQLNLGMLLAEMGKLPEAEQAFRAACKAEPSLSAAAYNLGVLVSRDRPDEAIEWCRRAFAARPTDARYGYTLGYFLAARQRFDDAIVVLEAVIRLRPASSEAYVLLVKIYQRLNRGIDLARVCRAAIENTALTPAERWQFNVGP